MVAQPVGPQRGATDAVDEQGQPLASRTGQMAPGAPESLFAAVGFGGQVLLVDPGSSTVVVRLGAPPPAGEDGYDFATAAQVVTPALR